MAVHYAPIRGVGSRCKLSGPTSAVKGDVTCKKCLSLMDKDRRRGLDIPEGKKLRGFGSQLDEAGCCDQCGRMQSDMDQAHVCQATAVEADDVMQKAPPGGEKVVKALKKQKDVKNPWAVAWAMKNRGEI